MGLTADLIPENAETMVFQLCEPGFLALKYPKWLKTLFQGRFYLSKWPLDQ
jgi:hypothetical protein